MSISPRFGRGEVVSRRSSRHSFFALLELSIRVLEIGVWRTTLCAAHPNCADDRSPLTRPWGGNAAETMEMRRRGRYGRGKEEAVVVVAMAAMATVLDPEARMT